MIIGWELVWTTRSALLTFIRAVCTPEIHSLLGENFLRNSVADRPKRRRVEMFFPRSLQRQAGATCIIQSSGGGFSLWVQCLRGYMDR